MWLLLLLLGLLFALVYDVAHQAVILTPWALLGVLLGWVIGKIESDWK